MICTCCKRAESEVNYFVQVIFLSREELYMTIFMIRKDAVTWNWTACPRKCMQYDILKRRDDVFTHRQDVTSQKTRIFSNAAVRTSYLAMLNLFTCFQNIKNSKLEGDSVSFGKWAPPYSRFRISDYS